MVFTARFAPLIETDVSELEAVARTIRREYLLTIDADSYYQEIRFVDPALTTIFDFEYIEGDETSAFLVLQIMIDEDFMTTYDIPLLAGRNLDRAIGADTVREEVTSLNVIVNELMTEKLGFGTRDEAIDKVFYDFPSDHGGEAKPSRVYTIIGVVPAQNFLGFHNRIKPTVFLKDPQIFRIASVHGKGGGMPATLHEIESVWDNLVPEYPIQSRFLNETFTDVFKIFSAMSRVLGGFAFLALTLSLIGLFGLAAFMVEGRAKEIGIRKIMGANRMQIITLLIWQFSKPVLWALAVAMPMAYAASAIYLDFFADRLTMPESSNVFAGISHGLRFPKNEYHWRRMGTLSTVRLGHSA